MSEMESIVGEMFKAITPDQNDDTSTPESPPNTVGMNETKFKIGDQVICVRPNQSLQIDKIYEIVDIDEVNDTLVKVEGFDCFFFANRFVLATDTDEPSPIFKVGDKVLRLDDFEHLKKGEVYTVKEVFANTISLVEDDKENDFHWTYAKYNFELYKEPNFNVGDRVRSLRDQGCVNKGSVHVVDFVSRGDLELKGIKGYFASDGFELVESTKLTEEGAIRAITDMLENPTNLTAGDVVIAIKDKGCISKGVVYTIGSVVSTNGSTLVTLMEEDDGTTYPADIFEKLDGEESEEPTNEPPSYVKHLLYRAARLLRNTDELSDAKRLNMIFDILEDIKEYDPDGYDINVR